MIQSYIVGSRYLRTFRLGCLHEAGDEYNLHKILLNSNNIMQKSINRYIELRTVM